MPQRFVSITFLQPPVVGQPAVAAVSEAPLGIWGPTDPRPGWGLPGDQPYPEHPIFYPPGIWGPTDPRPGWGLPGPQPPFPQPPMDPPSASWVFKDDGWYFVAGPFDKPRPIKGVGQSVVDLIDGGWKATPGGWYFVAGPYDKPRPIGPIDPPIGEPPELPPDAEGAWEYRDDGWYFTYGPLPKPQPPGGGGNPPPE